MFSAIYVIYGFLLIPPTLANLLMHSDGEVFLKGSSVRLNCSLEALNQSNYAPDDITWYHNETNLTGVRNPIQDATSSVLVLQDVQFDDDGAYTCSLIDARESATIDINIGLSPEPATALKCSSDNFDKANCTWNRGGQHSNLPTVDVVERRRRNSEWKVCTENSKRVSTTPSTCNQTTCYVVCQFQGMDATYRIKSTNLLGAKFSGEVSFNIDEETIPNPPSDVTVTNQSASSLLITWTPDPGVDEEKHLLVNYIVKYRWEGDEDWSQVKVKGQDAEKNTVLLPGLHPYGLYYIKVKCVAFIALQRSQYGQFSKVVSGRTSEIAPVDAPGNFSCHSEVVERTGKRNILLSWEVVPNKFKRNGEITTQIIRVRQMVHMQDSADIKIVGPNETSYILKDMELEEKYEISIRVRNSVRESGNYSLCSIHLIQTGGVISPVTLTFACVGIICLSAVLFWMGFRLYKKVMHSFPDFPLPSNFGNSNLYLSTQSPHRTVTREKEVYDELLSGDSLFVDLPPSEKIPLDSPGVSPGPNGNIAFSGTFDLGDKPQDAVAKFPLANDDEVNVPFSSPPHEDAHRHRHWSSETCTSSLNSPISVGSGGSYFVLRESDATTYCILAKDGFSPVKENNFKDQELLGAGSSAVGLTPSCLDLENDSDGEFSILGLESKEDSCKFGSPEWVLYTRKHTLPTLTDPKVSQPRLLKATTESPIKSTDAAGAFGLDEVTKEEKVESLGTIQENDDDMKEGCGGDEVEVKEAGGDLGLSGTSKKVLGTNEDDGINIPSENEQSSVGDVDKGGGASVSLCHTDQPDIILKYITVCKDDEEDDADGNVKTGASDDENLLTTESSSDTNLTEYPGSCNGTYIDQAQLANISPISSPTRSVTYYDFSDP